MTGRRLWATALPVAGTTLLAATGDTVVVAGSKYMESLSSATGALLWHRDVFQANPSPPVIAGGLVPVDGEGYGGDLYAFRLADGTPVWTSEPEFSGGPVTALPDRAITTSACGMAYAFALGDGAKLWNHHEGCSGERSLEPRWTFAGDGQLSSAPLIADGTVYVASSAGQVYAVDAATGEPEGSADAGPLPWAWDGPEGLAAGDGVLVVPTTSGLTALRAPAQPESGEDGGATPTATPTPAAAPTPTPTPDVMATTSTARTSAPATTTSVTASARPASRVRLRASAALRRGRLRVRLTCRGGARCRGTLVAGRRRRRFALAGGHTRVYVFAHARTVRVLDTRGRRLTVR